MLTHPGASDTQQTTHTKLNTVQVAPGITVWAAGKRKPGTAAELVGSCSCCAACPRCSEHRQQQQHHDGLPTSPPACQCCLQHKPAACRMLAQQQAVSLTQHPSLDKGRQGASCNNHTPATIAPADTTAINPKPPCVGSPPAIPTTQANLVR